MEIEAKFSLPDKQTLIRLQNVSELIGFTLTQPHIQRVLDTYLDTKDRKIQTRGYFCRIRQQGNTSIVTLKELTDTPDAIHKREEIETPLPAGLSLAEWPVGLVRELTTNLIGDVPLVPLFSLKQKRIIRDVIHGKRKVAEMSLDTIYLAADAKKKIFFECEIELSVNGNEDDLHTLATYLQKKWGLNSVLRSKFERSLAFIEGGKDL